MAVYFDGKRADSSLIDLANSYLTTFAEIPAEGSVNEIVKKYYSQSVFHAVYESNCIEDVGPSEEETFTIGEESKIIELYHNLAQQIGQQQFESRNELSLTELDQVDNALYELFRLTDQSRLNFKDKTKDALHVIKHTVALEYALAVMKLYGQSLIINRADRIINRADRIIQRAGRVSRDTANPIYISERDFLRVHHILMHNLLAPKQKHLSGKYKQEQNSIGGSELLLPLPDETPAYMKRWFEHSNKRLNGVFEGACIIEAAAWITHSFLMIHPFCDGNGRMSRILLNSILMSIGKMPFPIAIRGSAKKEKREYMKALDKASSRLSIFNADVGKTLDDYKLVIAKAIVKSFRQLDGKIIDQLSEDKAIRSYFD